jgi:hypothetical protein
MEDNDNQQLIATSLFCGNILPIFNHFLINYVIHISLYTISSKSGILYVQL